MDDFEKTLKELIVDTENERLHVQTSYEAMDLCIRASTLREVLGLYQKQTEALYQS